MSKSNTNPVLNDKAEVESHSILTKIGGLIFRVQKVFNPQKSSMVRDDSYIGLTDAHHSKVNLSSGGHVLVQAGSNLTLAASTHMNVSVKGDKQEVVAGDNVFYAKGHEKHLGGAQGDNEKAAAEGFQNSVNNIQQARLNAYTSATGNQVACPVCSTTHLIDHNGTGIIDRALSWLYDNIPFFCFPLDTVEHLINVLFAPLFLTPTKNIGLSGASGCGSPGCKGGMVESPVTKMEAADNASSQHIDIEKENLNKYSIALGCGGAKAEVIKTDVHKKIGLKKNTATAYVADGHHIIGFALKKSKPPATGADLYISSEGSTKRVIHHNPTPTAGSLIYDVANKFTVNAGTPGIDLLTGGRFHALAGDIIINATEGEAILASGNVTTVKGKNIILDAQDFSGDSGVAIQASQTMVHGGFSVRGNAAFKGHVTLDGSLSVPHLICPTMREESTSRSSSKFKTEASNWGPVAAGLAITNLAKDSTFRYLMPGYLMSLQGVYAMACEVYDALVQSMIIEPIPTGIAIGFSVGIGGGAVFCDVFNYKHNHGLCGNDHSHASTLPLMSAYQYREGWGGERQEAGPVPLPPPPYGDSPSPGPHSKPGGCGGGGLYTKNRNEYYGLDPENPFIDNYVPLPIRRSADGGSYTIVGKQQPQYSMAFGVPSLSSVLCGPAELN